MNEHIYLLNRSNTLDHQAIVAAILLLDHGNLPEVFFFERCLETMDLILWQFNL